MAELPKHKKQGNENKEKAAEKKKVKASVATGATQKECKEDAVAEQPPPSANEEKQPEKTMNVEIRTVSISSLLNFLDHKC